MANYIVTELSGDTGTISWAVSNAVAGDIITFDDSLQGENISIASVLVKQNVLLRASGENFSGRFSEIYGAVEINGGSWVLSHIISGNSYCSTVKNGGELRILNAKLTNNDNYSWIKVEAGGSLNLDGVESEYAKDYRFIEIEKNANAIIKNSSFKSKIECKGTLTVEGSSFSGNFVTSGTTSITDSAFSYASITGTGSILNSKFSILELGTINATVDEVETSKLSFSGNANFANLGKITITGTDAIVLNNAAGDNIRNMLFDGGTVTITAENAYLTYTGTITGENIISATYGISAYKFHYVTVASGATLRTTGENLSGCFTSIYGSVEINGGAFVLSYADGGNYVSTIKNGGELRILNAKLTRDDSISWTYIKVEAGGSLNLDGVESEYANDNKIIEIEENANANIKNSSFNSRIECKGTLTVEGSTFSGNFDATGETYITDSAFSYASITGPGSILNSKFAILELGTISATVNEVETSYSYTATGMLSRITYADGTFESYTYDANNVLSSWTNQAGQTITYAFDEAGNITQTVIPNRENISYSYDTAGNMISAGDISFSYDKAGNIVSQNYADGRSIIYSYDANGFVASVTDELGHTTNYTYTMDGCYDKLTNESGALIVDYDYNSDGSLAKVTHGNGTYSIYTYNVYGEVTDIDNYTAGNVLDTYTHYTYNNLGLRESMTTQDGTWTYSYDKLNQLTGAVFTNTSNEVTQNLAYTYDAMGNRLTASENGITTIYTDNNLNQIISANGFTYRYDVNGNLLEDEKRIYTWTADNRVASETLKSTGQVWEYGYDAMGNRVSSKTNGVTTVYTVDISGNVLGEYVDGVWNRSYQQAGLLVGWTGTDGQYYLNNDALGSVVSVSGAVGTVNIYSYDPFGNVLNSTETVANNFEYVGGYGLMANDSGTIFVRARNYDAETGRWISKDPIGIYGGINLYAYSANNPVMYIDVYGNAYCPVHGYYDDNFIVRAGDTVADHVGLVNNITGGYIPKVSNADKFLSSINIFKYIKDGYKNDGFMGAVYGGYEGAARVFGSVYGTVGGLFSGSIVGGVTNWDRIDGTWDGFAEYSWGVLKEAYYGGLAGARAGSDAAGWVGRQTARGLNPQGYKCNHSTPMCDGGEGGQGNPVPNSGDGTAAGGNSQMSYSSDPNDKLGPVGYGEKAYVSNQQKMDYTVRFENEEDATAPARWIRVLDTLDESLDLDTFVIEDFCLAGNLVTVGDGRKSYNQRITINVMGNDVLVDVQINLDEETRQITASFMAIDPETGYMLMDVTNGILFPNDDSGRGDGHISYSIHLAKNAATGTEVTNVAEIYFDFNEPIDTPMVSNTVDATDPLTPILAVVSEETTITLTMTGEDADSGIAGYNVMYSSDGVNFAVYGYTSYTELNITGIPGTTYYFKVQSVDNVGNKSAWSEVRSVKVSGAAPEKLAGSQTGLTWNAVPGASGYIVEYSTDNFEHLVRLTTEGNGVSSYCLPQGNYQWRVRTLESDEWVTGENIAAEAPAAEPRLIRSEADGNADVFFARTSGKWDSTYAAKHVGSVGDWCGTLESVTLNDRNKLSDIFEGSADASVLLMTDDANGDVLFVDDIYTALPGTVPEQQARIAHINEIRAGAGDDILDMTSQRFEYTGDGLVIRGGSGNDHIWANKGNNMLFGDEGNDRLIGASGNDVLAGGIGNDRMHGGGGNDIFTFCRNWGNDTVEQLADGTVTLWFISGSVDNWNLSTLTYTDGNNSVVVSGVGLDRITLKFGDDGSEQYAILTTQGAFADYSSEKIFEDKDKGMLAAL